MSDFSTIEEAIEAIKNGEIIIVVDDEDRENEGDLILAAQFITPDKVNFLTKHGRGLICVPMPEEKIEALDLTPMVQRNTALHGTKFTVSVDALKNTTTGISTHLAVPDTYFRSRPCRAECFRGPAIPKLPWTSAA